MLKYSKEIYPRISVIMPVKNRVDTIEKAILSLLDQNYPNYEFLILDSASDDGTLQIIEKYRDKISHFRSHQDTGPNAAVNEGIDKSSGEIISFLASDDWFSPNTLIRVGEAFIENPDVEMVNVLGHIVGKDGNGGYVDGCTSTVEDMQIYKGHVKSFHPNCRFFKKTIFNKYGRMIESVNGEMTYAPDYELITRLSFFNIKNITLDFIGYTYLAHEDSLTYNDKKYTKLKLADQKVFYIENFLKNYAHLLNNEIIESLRADLRKMLARRVVRNLVDKKYLLAKKNALYGIKEFGFLFIFRIIRYYISYNIRINKIIRKSNLAIFKCKKNILEYR